MTQEIERQNEEIITLVGEHPEGLSRGQISENMSFIINDKTLQRRLAALIDDGRVTRTGEKKGTRYIRYPSAKSQIEAIKRTYRPLYSVSRARKCSNS